MSVPIYIIASFIRSIVIFSSLSCIFLWRFMSIYSLFFIFNLFKLLRFHISAGDLHFFSLQILLIFSFIFFFNSHPCLFPQLSSFAVFVSFLLRHSLCSSPSSLYLYLFLSLLFYFHFLQLCCFTLFSLLSNSTTFR